MKHFLPTLGLISFLFLATSSTAQQLPRELEEQVKAGTMTRQEATALAGPSSGRPYAVAPSSPATSDYISPEAKACKSKEPCNRALLAGALYVLTYRLKLARIGGNILGKPSGEEEAYRNILKDSQGSIPADGPSKIGLISKCKKQLEYNLKAPASVAYPEMPEVSQVMNYVYLITGKLDAQNVGGAMIRSEFSCIVANKKPKSEFSYVWVNEEGVRKELF